MLAIDLSFLSAQYGILAMCFKPLRPRPRERAPYYGRSWVGLGMLALKMYYISIGKISELSDQTYMIYSLDSISAKLQISSKY